MNSAARAARESAQPLPSEATQPRGFSRFQIFRRRLGVVSDAMVGLVAFLVALQFHAWWGAGRSVGRPTLLACIVLWTGVLIGNWIERRCHYRMFAPWPAARNVLLASALAFSVLFFDRPLGIAISRLSVLIFSGVGLLFLAFWHYVAAVRFQWLRGHGPERVVLLGDPTICHELAEQMLDPLAYCNPLVLASPASGETAQGHLAKLETLLRSSTVDEVLFASTTFAPDSDLSASLHGVIGLCEATGTNLRVYSRWMKSHGHVYLDVLGSDPILSFSFAPASHWGLFVKRCLDVILALVGLALSFPLLVLAGLAIRLDSAGPVIFRQMRCGLRGRPFTLYKMRSMQSNAESLKSSLIVQNEMDGPVFKMTRDPRVTRVGYWLRRASIDELPQLYNVLRGDMSLVGPRPPLPEEVRSYSLQDLRRLAMKPGITGLWQVSGRNGISNFKEWVELDAAYIRDWSLLLDVKIMMKTIATVLRMTGK